MPQPAPPTLGVVDDGTGTSVTATFSAYEGDEQLLYRRALDGDAWIASGSGSGAIPIQVTGLTKGHLQFIGVSRDGAVYSLPSIPKEVTVGQAADGDAKWLADAIVDALNGRSFSKTFTAVRAVAPLRDRDEMATLRVTVVARELEDALMARDTDTRKVGIDVAVQQAAAEVSDGTPDPLKDRVDDLVALVQEIAAFLNRRDFSDASWLASKIEPLYDPAHLRELRQFTSVIRLTYWRVP